MAGVTSRDPGSGLRPTWIALVSIFMTDKRTTSVRQLSKNLTADDADNADTRRPSFTAEDAKGAEELRTKKLEKHTARIAADSAPLADNSAVEYKTIDFADSVAGE